MCVCICRVHLLVEEKVVMVANRDGGVDNLEVKGDLMLRIADADRGHIRVRLGNVNNKLFQFKVRTPHRDEAACALVGHAHAIKHGGTSQTHPNVDRNLFLAESVIGLKDASRPFPTGQPLGVVRWRFQSKEENDVPFYGAARSWGAEPSAHTHTDADAWGWGRAWL